MHASHNDGACAPRLAARELAAPADPAGLATVGAAAAAPAELIGPHKDEGPTGASGQAPKVQARDNNPDCEGPSAGDQPTVKHFATLRVRLALAGYVLTCIDDDNGAATYTATRWGRAAELRDLAAVQAFAARVGAPS